MQRGEGVSKDSGATNGSACPASIGSGIPRQDHPELVVQVIVPNPRMRRRIEACLRQGGIPTISDTALAPNQAFGAISAMVKITAREISVLDAMLKHDFAYEIGMQLGISTKAVENHIQRLMEKLEVHSRHRLVAAAVRVGLLNINHNSTENDRVMID